MTGFLFAAVWWIGLFAVACWIGLILAALWFTLRERRLDRNARQRIQQFTAADALERAWLLTSREPRA